MAASIRPRGDLMNHPRIVAVAFVLMTVLMTVSAPRIAHSDEIKARYSQIFHV